MKYFCDASKITKICKYKQYKPKVCCQHCDIREDCFADQIMVENVGKMPCLSFNEEDFQDICKDCEYLF